MMAYFFIWNGEPYVMETCSRCKTSHAFSRALYDVAMERREQGSITCPNGHSWHYKSQAEMDEDALLRRERDLLKQRVAQKDDEIKRQRELTAAAERQTSAQKAQVTRLKNRAKAGLCPCCNRHFTNLERHINGQHPDFTKEKAVA